MSKYLNVKDMYERILLCHQIGMDHKQIILDKINISTEEYLIEKARGVSKNIINYKELKV